MRLLQSFLPALCVAIALFATPAHAEKSAARILVMGDSMMAWNKGSRRSVGDYMQKQLGEAVKIRAVNGARIVYGLPISGSAGLKIAKQYRPGNWDWVVLNGGGNDLLFGCGCNKCGTRIERMISSDGRRGELVNMVARIRQSGAKVLYLGYLRSPGVGSMIENCRDEGDILDARIAKMAKAIRGVYFQPNADLVPHGDRSFHSGDMIHPSPKGSQSIAQRAVRLIRRVDKAR